MLGFTFIRADTSLFEIMFCGTIMGVGSGIFTSPNISTIMGMVSPERRGIAGGTKTMMNNAGQVVSIEMFFAIIASGLTPQAKEKI